MEKEVLSLGVGVSLSPRELSHRMHQLSYREQLMMMASKLASVPMREISEFGKVFPELRREEGKEGKRGGGEEERRIRDFHWRPKEPGKDMGKDWF